MMILDKVVTYIRSEEIQSSGRFAQRSSISQMLVIKFIFSFTLFNYHKRTPFTSRFL